MRVDAGGAPDTHIDNTIVAGNTKTATVPADTDLHGAFTGSFDLVQNLGDATLAGGPTSSARIRNSALWRTTAA